LFSIPDDELQDSSKYIESNKFIVVIAKSVKSFNHYLKNGHNVGIIIKRSSISLNNILGKPFNPLLGETYEIERPSFRCLCEQVSHHPPISSFHADSPGIFEFYGSIYPKLKFWGKSVEIQPKGTVTLKLPKFDEIYTWQNVNCTIHNVIVGKLWIEQYGNLEITNHKTGIKAVINFKPAGSSYKDLHRVEGTIVDKE
jgi:oxysterol-binding protein-related protein 1/2